MGVSGSGSHGRAGLTPRQEKWFASVKASLERDTGRSMDEWVEIVRSCPETKPKARADWLRENYGLGVNRAAQILSAAFPSGGSWDDDPDKLRAMLWSDPDAAAIFQAVEKLALALPDTIVGQRKAFTAFSHEFQFASIKPVKGGKAMLGLALTPDADSRLQEPKNEGWSERLKSKLLLENPHQVDASVAALLKAARDRS
jgi:hypothetical protein